LYAAALGLSHTAPQAALQKYERWLFCKENGWTLAEYDAATASDIALAREFAKIHAAALKKATTASK